MAVQKLTQRAVDALVTTRSPERDVLLWSDREAGFGLKRAAGSRRASYVYQWRDPRTGRSHRLSLGDAAKLTLDDARKAMQARAGEIAAGKNPILERRRYQAAPTFAELVTRYLASENWRRKAPSTQAGDARRIQLYLLPGLATRKLCEITLADLKALHASLCDPTKADALARRGGAIKNTPRGGEGVPAAPCGCARRSLPTPTTPS